MTKVSQEERIGWTFSRRRVIGETDDFERTNCRHAQTADRSRFICSELPRLAKPVGKVFQLARFGGYRFVRDRHEVFEKQIDGSLSGCKLIFRFVKVIPKGAPHL